MKYKSIAYKIHATLIMVNMIAFSAGVLISGAKFLEPDLVRYWGVITIIWIIGYAFCGVMYETWFKKEAQ